jgi:hypothetical protein
MRRYWTELLISALYLILTLIMLYPFSVLKMGSQLIGDGGDNFQGLWNLWWVKQSTLSLSNPYITHSIFYPQGADLSVHSLSPAAGFLTIPFQLTLGLVFSYNLLVVLSFVLGGYGAFRLAYHVTSDKKASFFAGLVFGFSSYHFARAFGHLNLVSIQWIPFYVLFLLKMRNEKSLKNIFYAVAFLVLTGLMADLQYIVFLGLFTLFYVGKELIVNREKITKFLMRLGIMVIISSAILLLFLAPLIYGWFTGKYAYATNPASDSVALSADLLSFFTPSPLNPFFGKYSAGIVSNFSTSMFPIEGIVYIGYTVLALAIYAAIKLRKRARFWLLGSLVFMILSLGPTLHILGSSEFTSLHVSVPLPELILVYVVPIFRVPSRIILMATLCLAVVSAIGLKHVNKLIATHKKGKLVSVIFVIFLSATLVAECNMVPFPVVEDTSVPSFYYQLAKMDGTFSVLDLPQNYVANNRYMYYSTVSGKPLFEGSISRLSPANIQQVAAVPIISQTDSVVNGKGLMTPTDIILQDLNLTNLNAFQIFNVKYVILHKYLMSNAASELIAAYLSSIVGSPVYSDEKTVVFEIPQATLHGPFAYLTDGWWNTEERNGFPTRWMGNNGTVEVLSPSALNCNLSFYVGTDNADKTLKVFLNNEPIGEFQVSTTAVSHISLNVSLKNGANELSLYSEQSFIPANVGGSPSDTRRLSVYVQNVEISS